MNTEMLTEFIAAKLPQLIVMSVFALLDLIGGILIALKMKEFKWECVPEFVKTFAVYLWSWVSAELVSFLPIALGVAVNGLAQIVVGFAGGAVYAFVILKYVASILTHIQDSDVLPLKAERAMTNAGVPKTTPQG